jgi:lipopolysaccharide heptosyltransferase II
VKPLARYRYVRLRWRMLFAIIDFAGGLVTRLIGVRRGVSPLVADRAGGLRSPRSILLVQLDHLGDAILSIGLLRGLKAAWPRARIDVLASPSNAQLFDCLPEVRRVFVAQVTRFCGAGTLPWIASTLRWGWSLRRYRYDLAIDPRGDLPAAVILRLCGAPVRLGWGCGGGGFLLTHQAEFVWGRHEVLSRQALLDELNIVPPSNAPAWPPRLVASRFASEEIDRRLSASSPRIVLHVGAGTHAKRWPAEHWQELIGRLILEYDASIVLVGSAADRELVGTMPGARRGSPDPADAWTAGLPPVLPGVQNWCGKLSLDELAALIERANLLISGDSGPAHLAAAVGTPVVVLFSGTNNPEQWRPWGVNVRVVNHSTPCSPCHLASCPLRNHPCMRDLQPLAVLAAAREFLPLAADWATYRRTAV